MTTCSVVSLLVLWYVVTATNSAATSLPFYAGMFSLPVSLQPISWQIYPVAAPVLLSSSGTVFVAYFNNHSATAMTSTLVAYNAIQATPTSPLLVGTAVFSASGSIISTVSPFPNRTAVVSVAQVDSPSASGASVVELRDNSVPGTTQIKTLFSMDRLNSSYRQLLAIPQLNMIIFTALLPARPAPYPQMVEVVAVSTNSSSLTGSVSSAPNDRVESYVGYTHHT
jgi:hypothetical protein